MIASSASMVASTPAARANDAVIRIPLASGWEAASTPESCDPSRAAGLRFVPAEVPGTIASAMRKAGEWRRGAGVDFDDQEHWFRCGFESEPVQSAEDLALELDGIATLSDVWLNGRHILCSSSMFEPHAVDVSSLIRRENELLIVCRSLSAALKEKRGQQPAARWRTRVAGEQQLRWFRTTLLGRAPGFAPEPAPVGPWRPITLVRRRKVEREQWSQRAEIDGTVRAEIRLRVLEPRIGVRSARLCVGETRAQLELEKSGGRYHGTALLRLPRVDLWQPHTHGEPALYESGFEVELDDGSRLTFEDDPIGFRSAGFSDSKLSVNGVPIFCRGVVWTPPDPVAFASPEATVRQRLETLRDAGFNLIRIAGTTVYESETFHRLCDQLGLLVWQDMMFANMDYPFADSSFAEVCRREAERELARLSRHASTAIICGNSEIEQQASMLGLDPALGRGSFFYEELPGIAGRCCPGVPYIPSAPSGGDLPFRTKTGVANYFGAGAYLRPLEDVRRAEVRFASECLAFSNVPEPETMEKMAARGGISPAHPAWKRAVPRDAGAGWDFEDVRDHYLKLLYGIDPVALRYSDVERYWELSRLVSGEVMAEVFGEWRRSGSPCGGGIILWGVDLEPGAGWGILDSYGVPKAAYWCLKRVLAPLAIWTTDEGLNGIDVHLANDRAEDRRVWLRVALYGNGERKIQEAEREIELQPRGGARFGIEELLGRFVDASYAYRFGPPAHDLIAASVHIDRGHAPIAQCFRLPAGRRTDRLPMSELGINGAGRLLHDGTVELLLSARRFVNAVRVAAPGFLPGDCYFGLEPGGMRELVLRPLGPGKPPGSVVITASNAEGRLTIPVERTG